MYKFVSLFALSIIPLATGCQPGESTRHGTDRDGPSRPDEDDPGTALAYPYTGNEEPGYLIVEASFAGAPVDQLCAVVIYDGTGTATQAEEGCGVPIAVPPGVQLMVALGDLNERCESCAVPNQLGGIWSDLPLLMLPDGGKAVSNPLPVTIGSGVERVVALGANQYAEGVWHCAMTLVDYGNTLQEATSEVDFSGTNEVSLPFIGEFALKGREGVAIGVDMGGEGSFSDSFTFHFDGFGAPLGGMVGDCVALP